MQPLVINFESRLLSLLTISLQELQTRNERLVVIVSRNGNFNELSQIILILLEVKRQKEPQQVLGVINLIHVNVICL